MISRPMRHTREEIRQVQYLRARCHPGLPVPVAEWYIAHPTLVIEGVTTLKGSTSFSVAPAINDGRPEMVLYGADVCVAPEERGMGLAHILHVERCRVAQLAGAVIFVGVTRPDNAPMIRVLTKTGAEPGDLIKGYYLDGTDGVIYTAVLGGAG